MPKTITLLGKRYRISFEKVVIVDGKKVRGCCDPPGVKDKAITISLDLHGQERLEILLHEMLHACDWHKDETWVETVAHDISRVLWRLGYETVD